MLTLFWIYCIGLAIAVLLLTVLDTGFTIDVETALALGWPVALAIYLIHALGYLVERLSQPE